MRIVIVGATGTIGSAVVKAFEGRHDVVKVSRKSDTQVDIGDLKSIKALFQKTGKFDALVSTVGKVHFGELGKMTDTEVRIGIDNKLMGQVNLVLVGQEFLNDRGSFTLTSGLLNHHPIRYGAAASLANGALDGFVKGAALELGRDRRINVVSPGLLTESVPSYGPYFAGFDTVDAERVARAYVRSVEGLITGEIITVL